MNRKYHSVRSNFNYLFQELHQYRSYSVLLPILASITQISLSLLMIYIPKVILDLVGKHVEPSTLIRSVFTMGMGLIVISILNLIGHNEIIICSEGFLYRHLVKIWEEKMMDLDYETFTSREGKLKAEKARNAWGVSAYLGRVTSLLENCLGFLAYSAMIYTLHPLIVLLLLIMFGIQMWFGIQVENKKQTIKEEKASISRKLNYIAYWTRGIQEGKDIRIYSMRAWLRQVTHKVIARKDQVETKSTKWDFQCMLLSGFLIFLRNGAAYLYLIYMFCQGQMAIGDFVLYFAAITGIGDWLSKLSQSSADFMEINYLATDFREFMALQGRKAEGIHTISELTCPVSFSMEDVSFSYKEMDEEGREKEIPVLRHMNLQIEAGEKIALVGANGAGKTTFIKLLCGLLQPKAGKILVNGRKITDFSSDSYLELFSAVFQKSGVLPISIKDNIALNIKGEADETLVWECIRSANLEKKVMSLPEGIETSLVKRISEQGTDLSGGELQRLLLARALYKNAPVLILDEPTAALDPIAEHDIYQKYCQFTEGKTAIFISHRLASTRFCDRIIFLEEGSIVESGSHEELMKRGGRYAEMFRVQSQYYEEGEN